MGTRMDMGAKIVKLPAFYVVGYKLESSVEEFESGLGQQVRRLLSERKDEIAHRKNDHMILIQIYPCHPEFDAAVDRFTNVICYEVTKQVNIPSDMILHQVPANSYVTCTHTGLEENIGDTYQYLYQDWMESSNNEPLEYDFEVWDARYKPNSKENEIDIFVALKS